MTRTACRRSWLVAVALTVGLGIAAPPAADADLGGAINSLKGAVGRAAAPVVQRVQPVVNRVKWVVQKTVVRPRVAEGAVAGRFQVVHHDHIKYILAAAKKCQRLTVGITNPDPSLTRADATDPSRSRPENNPLTYIERHDMVTAALTGAGLRPGKDFNVVPLPINFPELYGNYLPAGATCYVTAYDDWGEKKLQQFVDQGFNAEMLWKRPKSEKGISATDVRTRMATGQPWEHLVPGSAATLLKQWGVPARLARLAGEQP